MHQPHATSTSSPIHRREALRRFAEGVGSTLIAGYTAIQLGCTSSSPSATPERILGRLGIGPGRFQKPRAIAIDPQDRLFVVDMTGRIQALTVEGESIALWRTPEIHQGKPTGLTIAPDGRLLVADTHYARILEYEIDGTPLPDRTLGGTFGAGPGEFGLVTDVAIDSQGCRYVSEYGEFDRIQKFSPDHQFLMQWGSHGSRPEQFLRPQSIEIDQQDHLWVADACNHRIQVFDATGDQPRLVQIWGTEGKELGQLRYPYGLKLGDDNDLYVAEFGNHRVQRFRRDGTPLEAWGRAGRAPGELDQPWAVARDSQGLCYVLDSYNHRIQVFRFSS